MKIDSLARSSHADRAWERMTDEDCGPHQRSIVVAMPVFPSSL